MIRGRGKDDGEGEREGEYEEIGGRRKRNREGMDVKGVVGEEIVERGRRGGRKGGRKGDVKGRREGEVGGGR